MYACCMILTLVTKMLKKYKTIIQLMCDMSPYCPNDNLYRRHPTAFHKLNNKVNFSQHSCFTNLNY